MTTNTRPVPNTSSPIVDTATGKLLAPWIQFFQQFVQKAPTVQDVSATNPYQANQTGVVIITGTGITITRGQVTINLVDGQHIIPIAISDTIAWATASAVQFLGS